MISRCIICGSSVRKSHHSNASTHHNPHYGRVFSKYFNHSPVQIHYETVWANRLNENPFCGRCKSSLDKLVGHENSLDQISREINNIVNNLQSTSSVNNNNMHSASTNSYNNNCGGNNKRLTTTTTIPNGYIQQPIVIPTWSNHPGIISQGQVVPQALGQDPSGLVRDWNWRPELAYTSGPTATPTVNLDGLTSEFGITQQRFFPIVNVTTMASSASSSTSSSITTGSKMTVPKPRNSTCTTSDSRTSDMSQLSSWSSKGEEVVEKFYWNDKYECEKLVNGEFICNTCGAVKKSRQLLISHLTYHRLIESRKFSCTYCSKSFCRQREVARHEKTHLTALTNGKAQKKEKSEKDLGNGNFLYEGQWGYQRVPTANGGEQFRCSTCGTTKDNKKSMLSHLRWVHSLKTNNGRNWSLTDASDWSDLISTGSMGSSPHP